MLQFHKLIIENYKIFSRTEILFEPDLTIFLGTNGAGKTSFLEVLSILHELTMNSQSSWLGFIFQDKSSSGFIGCFPFKKTESSMGFEIWAKDEKENHLSYRLSLVPGPQGMPVVFEEKFSLNGQLLCFWDKVQGQFRIPVAKAAPSHDGSYPFLLNQSAKPILHQFDGMSPLIDFIDWVSSWMIIRPELMHIPRDIEQIDAAKNTRLNPTGSNFAPVLFHWKNSPTLKPRFERISSFTHILLSDLGMDNITWDVLPETYGERLGVRAVFWERESKHWKSFDITYGPTGILQWFITLTALCAPEATLVAFEEPDSFIDIRMLETFHDAIMTILEEFCRPVMKHIIFTTHSPAFAGLFRPEHIRILERGNVHSIGEEMKESLRSERIKLLEAWLLDMLESEVEVE